MEEQLIQALASADKPTTLFLLATAFIVADIITGLLKALKYRKGNSSISRDGFIKKGAWYVLLLLGWCIELLVNTNAFLYLTTTMIIVTEGMSLCENLGELGIKNVPLRKYLEKLNNEEGE